MGEGWAYYLLQYTYVPCKVFTSENTEEGETFEGKKNVSYFFACKVIWEKKNSFHYSLVPARRATPPLSVWPIPPISVWPNGEWGYSNRWHKLGPERPEAVLPDRALCLPTFRHSLIVMKPSLSLSLSLIGQAAESDTGPR